MITHLKVTDNTGLHYWNLWIKESTMKWEHLFMKPNMWLI